MYFTFSAFLFFVVVAIKYKPKYIFLLDSIYTFEGLRNLYLYISIYNGIMAHLNLMNYSILASDNKGKFY